MALVKQSGAAAPKMEVKEEAQKVVAGTVAANASTENLEGLGSKSGSIEFIAPLGDPSRQDTVQGEHGKSVTSYIVGYRFKALEDMEVPECGLDPNRARADLMSFANKDGKKAVKAGEEFDLTRFETGLLLAPVEFNGRITGGGKNFTAVFVVGNSKSATAGKDAIPTVSLRAESGSIKDYNMIDVLTFTTKEIGKDSNGKPVNRKERTIKPGFEKWEPLCIPAKRPTREGGVASTPKDRRNENARKFLDIVAAK